MRRIHLLYQKDHNCTNTQSRNGKRQALFCYELYKQLAASVLGGLLVLSVLHITVGHRQLPIVWEHWSAKKPRKLQKWPTAFHTHKKKGFWNCQSWKIFFSSNFIIQLHLNFFQNSDTQGTCFRHICVWMLN